MFISFKEGRRDKVAISRNQFTRNPSTFPINTTNAPTPRTHESRELNNCKMNRGSKDDGFEVSDSTDWIETPLPSLCQVDSALRCQVCKDFYNTPMITSCNHSFCSLCIRRCLTSDGKCPACRAPDQELKLKHNPVLEDVVEAFKRARQQVLEFARKPVAGVESSQVKRKRGGSQLRVDESPQKRTRMSGRRTRSSQNEVVIEDSEGEDEDFIPGMSCAVYNCHFV